MSKFSQTTIKMQREVNQQSYAVCDFPDKCFEMIGNVHSSADMLLLIYLQIKVYDSLFLLDSGSSLSIISDNLFSNVKTQQCI